MQIAKTRPVQGASIPGMLGLLHVVCLSCSENIYTQTALIICILNILG